MKNDLTTTLLHEWAHVYQDPMVPNMGSPPYGEVKGLLEGQSDHTGCAAR